VLIFEVVFKLRNRFERAIDATTASISMTVVFISRLTVAVAIDPVFYADVSLADLAAAFHHRIALRRRMLIELWNKQIDRGSFVVGIRRWFELHNAVDGGANDVDKK
jgi:hypothetical protein